MKYVGILSVSEIAVTVTALQIRSPQETSRYLIQNSVFATPVWMMLPQILLTSRCQSIIHELPHCGDVN